VDDVISSRSCAYFFTHVHSPEERDALITLSPQHGNRCWLNGEHVFSEKALIGSRLDNNVVRVHLNKGTNGLLLRVDRYLGNPRMSCRIVGLDGNAMPDVVVGVDGA